MSALGLGCVKTRRGASAGKETSVQITAGGQKFASESDFNRPKKNQSIATGRGKLQVQPCPQCPVSDVGPKKSDLFVKGHYRKSRA
jgi:hypothetical protein